MYLTLSIFIFRLKHLEFSRSLLLGRISSFSFSCNTSINWVLSLEALNKDGRSTDLQITGFRSFYLMLVVSQVIGFRSFLVLVTLGTKPGLRFFSLSHARDKLETVTTV